MVSNDVFFRIAAQYVDNGDLGKLQNDLKNVTEKTQSWWDVMNGILAADIVRRIAQGVIQFGKDCVNAYLESEVAINRLTQALKNNGTYTKGLEEEYLRFSKQLQANTTYTDEQVDSVMSLLSSFGIMGTQLEKTTQAVLNLSTTQGMDLQATTMLLGKAFEGNTQALGRMGIQFLKSGDSAVDFERVLGAIQKRTGESASSELNTFAGEWKNLSNLWGEFMEKIGGKLVPYLEKVVDFLKFAADWYGIVLKKREDMKYLDDAEYLAGRRIAETYGIKSAEFKKWYAIWKPVNDEREAEAEKELAQADELARKLKVNNDLLNSSRTTAITAGQAYTEAFTAATRSGESFNESLSAGLEAAGQSALRTFKNFLLKKLEVWYEEQLAEQTISAISTKGATAWQIAASTAEYAVGIAAINAAIPYADGGIVTKPTFALIGEAGAEAVVPLTKRSAVGDQLGLSGGGNTVILQADVFMGNEMEALEFAKKVSKNIDRLKSKELV